MIYVLLGLPILLLLGFGVYYTVSCKSFPTSFKPTGYAEDKNIEDLHRMQKYNFWRYFDSQEQKGTPTRK